MDETAYCPYCKKEVKLVRGRQETWKMLVFGIPHHYLYAKKKKCSSCGKQIK